MSGLRNPKHEIFAQEIASGKPALEAYKVAGFKRPRDSNARRLRNTDPIRTRVREIALIGAELAGAHSGAIQQELARLGFANMLDYIGINGEGLPYVDLSSLTREQAAAIAEFTIETLPPREDDGPPVTRVRFKLHPKVSALAELAKLTGDASDPLADAVSGIGDRLDRAIQRIGTSERA